MSCCTSSTGSPAGEPNVSSSSTPGTGAAASSVTALRYSEVDPEKRVAMSEMRDELVPAGPTAGGLLKVEVDPEDLEAGDEAWPGAPLSDDDADDEDDTRLAMPWAPEDTELELESDPLRAAPPAVVDVVVVVLLVRTGARMA